MVSSLHANMESCRGIWKRILSLGSSALKPLWKAQAGPLEMKILKCDQRELDIARRINVSAKAQ